MHYLKEIGTKMADSLFYDDLGNTPKTFLFKYFVDGIHLLEGVLFTAAAHMIAWVVIGWHIELHGRTVAQRWVGINLLHEDSPDRQSHGGSLTHTHGVEVDVALLAAYPATAHQLRSKGDEPTVAVVVGSTRLGTNLALQLISVAQAAGSTVIHHAHHHVEHLHGIVGTDHLVHSRLEGSNGVTLVVLNAAHEHRSCADAVVGKGGIGTHHLAHAHFARTQAQAH